MSNELLFYLGLLITGIAVIAGIILSVYMLSSWKRLNAKLDVEYGKKRR